jgi:hypothetical protein
MFEFTNPAADRAKIAQWLALLSPERARAILAIHGAGSLARLHPGRFVAVMNAAKGELESRRRAPTLAAMPSVERTRHVSAATLAPLRAALAKAEASYASASKASDAADSDMRAAYAAMIETSDASEKARMAAHKAEDGGTFTRAQFDLAVARYETDYAAHEAASAAYDEARRRHKGLAEAKRAAARIMSDAARALGRAESV